MLATADRTTPLMIACINGKFATAMYLLERSASPQLASMANGTPLYGVINVQWAPKAFYPQPTFKQEKTSRRPARRLHRKRPDGRRHGKWSDPTSPTVSRYCRSPGVSRIQEQPQVRVLLIPSFSALSPFAGQE